MGLKTAIIFAILYHYASSTEITHVCLYNSVHTRTDMLLT